MDTLSLEVDNASKVQITVRDQAFQDLAEARKILGLSSLTDTVRKALSFFVYILNKTKNEKYELWLVREGENPRVIHYL